MPAVSKKKFAKSKHGGIRSLNGNSKLSFKPKSTDGIDGAVRAPAVSLNLEDDVPAFPRGNNSKQRKSENSKDRLKDGNAASEFKRIKKKKIGRTAMRNKLDSTAEWGDDLGSLFGEGVVTGRVPRFANRITSKNISPGMKLWGVVAEVNDKDVMVSLPGGLRGLVRLEDAFDPVFCDEGSNILPRLFSVGQLVLCSVCQVDEDKKGNSKRKIRLSLRLSSIYKGFSFDSIQEGMVLTSYVKSIEDHGYILHFGISSFVGFLARNSNSEDTNVKPGLLVEGVVEKIDRNRKVIYICNDRDAVSKSLLKDVKGMSIDLLVPGMLVNARIHSVLENGIMLSFLTYFTGTVDIFHLETSLPSTRWKNDYTINKKVNARILFIDPSTRAIGLTMNQHLIRNTAPPLNIKIGDIHESAKVVRVGNGTGILFVVASEPTPTPVYVGTSDFPETGKNKIEKVVKGDRPISLRVLGFRSMEGLAVGTLKINALDGPIVTHSDVKPGMVVKAKIVSVDSLGAIVLFSGGIKALCPLRHMSEFEIVKPRKKFTVGAELVFRVLGCKSKRITVTHKKTMVKSKYPVLSSYADATTGMVTHGWITKIESHGCFVHFYNGVQGFTPRSELGLEHVADISLMYHIGQVVKCRVVSSVPASHRINLSFIMKPSRVSEVGAIKQGSIVTGVVEKITECSVIVSLKSYNFLKGIITTEHLADHYGQALLLKLLVKPGYEFDQLVVLDLESKDAILSAKYSLISSANELPADITHIQPHKMFHGYICNIIETGCFVRFLGRFTAFSPRSKAIDDKRIGLEDAFYDGQTVHCYIDEVNNESKRVTVSLKQSVCASSDASFIKGYFALEDKVVKLQSLNYIGQKSTWIEEFAIGSVVEGKVHELKEFGAVIHFEKYNDVFGFITQYQLNLSVVKTGDVLRAVVLDVAKTERLVDLSLKQEFLGQASVQNATAQTAKKKRKGEAVRNLELHQKVNALVEIVKENYLVLSIPENNNIIGYASSIDYNIQKLPQTNFINGQNVLVTVAAFPSQSTGGRLILSLNSLMEGIHTSALKKARKNSSYSIGSLVLAEVTEIKPLEMKVKFGVGFRGRVHVTEVNDETHLEDPFQQFKIGQTINAKIVGVSTNPVHMKHTMWELSTKPSILLGSKIIDVQDVSKFAYGHPVAGYVYKVEGDWVWLAISWNVRAQIFILDTSSEPIELSDVRDRFGVGKVVNGHVLSVNKEKSLLRLVLREIDTSFSENFDPTIVNQSDGKHSDGRLVCHIREGSIIGGRISKILPGVGGLLVQVGPNVFGRVHITELQESWVSDPLSGFEEGHFVKCKVLEIKSSAKGTIHLDLSLRIDCSTVADSSSDSALNKRVTMIDDVHPGMMVQGYVKNVSSKGCFICLSRKFDAKIQLSNLSDRYVDDPEKEYPIGKHVVGRVLVVEPLSMRIEVSLRESNGKTTSKSNLDDLSRLNVGNKIVGIVRRVERYGLFIAIENTNLVGLCHISQLPGDHADCLDTTYIAGEKVTAKILKIDEERGRISLGMKSLEEEDCLSLEKVETCDLDESDSNPMLSVISSSPMDQGPANYDISNLAHIESRAYVPPLEITLDDIGVLSLDVGSNQPEHDDTQNKENKKRTKKISKDEREEEIRAAEERLLKNDIPQSADDFEKLVRSSPNSSLIWIKYMAFMLSLTDVEKARSIAERALKTINVREENEKLNVWVAYFNLENEYGNPSEEAVKKVFERAIQYCDPKKVYHALLGMYERTNQSNLANDLLEKMVKKFKHSCKIWLKKLHSVVQTDQEGVQVVVRRALLCLPQRKHIKFISKAAILEFKHGVPDRGRSMFETILKEYPKRMDLWSIYLSQEIRIGDPDVIRSLFERAIAVSLAPKKMKFIFKRYLEYEESLGDQDRIESVKRKAMEYVENTLG